MNNWLKENIVGLIWLTVITVLAIVIFLAPRNGQPQAIPWSGWKFPSWVFDPTSGPEYVVPACLFIEDYPDGKFYIIPEREKGMLSQCLNTLFTSAETEFYLENYFEEP